MPPLRHFLHFTTLVTWQYRIILGTGLLFVFIFLAFTLQFHAPDYVQKQHQSTSSSETETQSNEGDKTQLPTPPAVNHKATTASVATTHLKIFSNMTEDGKWFPIEFADRHAYNLNIIPHPDKEDTWIVVAQRDKSRDADIVWFIE